MTAQSKTNANVTSRVDIVDIISKSDLNLTSKSGFNPISIAQNAPGAADIAAMAGAFSACQLGTDWKEDIEVYLT